MSVNPQPSQETGLVLTVILTTNSRFQREPNIATNGGTK